MCSALENSSLYVSFVQGHFVCMYVNLYLHTGNQLSLSKKLKVMTTGLHDCRVGIRYISATFLIFRLKCSTDTAFFKLLGKLFHNMAPL